MAHAFASTLADLAGTGAKPALSFPKRLLNAIVASRVDAAERELRRHEVLFGETARVHGAYRRISLDKAGLLPFAA